MIGNSQIGNIFPTEIAEIISIGDGEFYDIPQGYAFQPMISKENSINVYSINGSNRDYLFDSYGRGLIGGGYSVKGDSEFFSGILLDFSNSDFNLIFEVDTDFESSLNLSVPANKFWYLLSYQASNIPFSNDRFGVLPENFEVVLNSTSQFCCDLNEDGVYNEIENDIIKISQVEKDYFINLFDIFLNQILGLNFKKDNINNDSVLEILLKLRDNARKHKDYKLSDSIRDELAKIGINLNDKD